MHLIHNLSVFNLITDSVWQRQEKHVLIAIKELFGWDLGVEAGPPWLDTPENLMCCAVLKNTFTYNDINICDTNDGKTKRTSGIKVMNYNPRYVTVAA
jgi:hypothetical protein